MNSLSLFYNSLGTGLLFALDPEVAHGLSIKALKAGFHPRFNNRFDPRLAVSVAGLSFPNPLGMAAGYDKNADVPDALLSMGFGHTEVGTVTPQPQPGNPKPRVFRLVEDKGVINRLGFNSKGHRAAHDRLARRMGRAGIVGVNIGANKTSTDFAADYVAGIAAFADVASYFTINISSPNTPGLRALQGADPLKDLMSRVSEARSKACDVRQRNTPLFLKIAPDLDETELDAIAAAMQDSDFDGLIVSNTTLSRRGLKSSNKSETGGLSGKPAFELSTIVLAKMFQRLGGSVPLIGVGGISDTATALAKIEAGASLIQLYTGLIYGGPDLPARILKGLSKILDNEKVEAISDLVGRNCNDWASRPLPKA